MIEVKPGNTQILVDSGDHVEITVYVDGTATAATGTPTVTITRDDGTTVVTAQNTTTPSTGVYRYSLTPAQVADLDILTATWSATVNGAAVTFTTRHEIVGGFYVTLGELRAMPNLSDNTKFTATELADARQWFETLAEEYCGQAFVPRYKKYRFTGSGTSDIMLDPNIRTVRSVRDYTDATTYTAFTADELADIDIDPVGVLTRMTLGYWRAGTRNLVIVYEHGMTSCPEDLRQAAKVAIRNHLLEDYTGRTVLSVTNEVGEFVRYSTPGMGRPTGNSEVDTVLNRYRLVAVG